MLTEGRTTDDIIGTRYKYSSISIWTIFVFVGMTNVIVLINIPGADSDGAAAGGETPHPTFVPFSMKLEGIMEQDEVSAADAASGSLSTSIRGSSIHMKSTLSVVSHRSGLKIDTVIPSFTSGGPNSNKDKARKSPLRSPLSRDEDSLSGRISTPKQTLSPPPPMHTKTTQRAMSELDLSLLTSSNKDDLKPQAVESSCVNYHNLILNIFRRLLFANSIYTICPGKNQANGSS